jgi:uncharacterized membrane protein YfhO
MRFDSGLRQSQLSSARAHVYRGLFDTLIVTLLLIILGLVLYRDFIFGGKTLLYKDIGSDSVNIYYPYFVHLSDYIRHYGIPSWSFNVGMGQNLFPYLGGALISPVAWLAKGLIAKALVYQHLLYLTIAGVFFARFLADRGLAFGSCLLGAILLSFSGYMCMGSCWYFQATEVVCFTFLLFAAERAIGHGRWFYLVIAVALVGLLGAFHLYLCALLLSFYVPTRLLERYSWQPLSILRICVALAAVAFLGVGLAAVVTLPNLIAILNSPRGSGTTSSVATLSSFPVFGLESHLHYITACLRPFANDILGTGSHFRGWYNYLEAPVSYCGLFCLLVFPQVFIRAIWRRRVIYLLFLIGIGLLTLFPWFRYLFWAFQGDYYRTFSLFSIFGVVTLSMTAFSQFLKDRAFNLWVLGLTTFVLVGILYFPLSEGQPLIDPHFRRVIAIFLLLYAALLVVGQLMKRQGIAAWIIIGSVAVELLCFDRNTVALRPVVTKPELNDRVGYNDHTIDAIRDIKANEPNQQSFFRVTKTWSSSPAIDESLNDALVFGYYGTASYSSFNNLDYIKFLMAVDVIGGTDIQNKAQWARGLVGRAHLATFACEKYVLTNNPVPFQVSGIYEPVNRYDSIHVFRNKYSFPFGVSYDRYIPEDLFLKLPTSDKPWALFFSSVMSEKDIVPGLSPLSREALQKAVKSTSINDLIAARRANGLTITSFSQTNIEGTIRLREKAMLVFQMPFDLGWHALVDSAPARTLKVDVGLLGVLLGGGEHTVELRYRPPFLAEGAALSLMSMVVLALSLRHWPRICLPN